MSRRKKINYKEEESGEDETDFSASEDEWKPNEVETSEAESEEENDADFDADTTERLAKRGSLAKKTLRLSSSSSHKGSSSKHSRTVSTLRNRMLKKYNPRPRITPTSPSRPICKDISKILELSQYKRKKSIASSHEEGDSDSSGNDYLIQPNKLDLKSSFFDIGSTEKTQGSQDTVPEFDCNAGMKLSDSEDDEMEEVEPETSGAKSGESTEKKSSNLIAGINQKSAGQIDFQQLIKYNKEAREAEDKLRNMKSPSFKNDDVNVSKLLALGEGTSQKDTQGEVNASKKRKKTVKADVSDSDTDWEQVQESETALLFDSKDILQINIPLSTKTSSDEKKKTSRDVELMIKRKLNRDLKEYQMYLHKVSLICHIAHGLYCNRILNSPTLMAAALKLLPNKTCYPDGATSIKYFESFAKWYKQAIPIRKNQMYLGTKNRPKIGISLALQIKYKEALCKKDFVLIFIILLRAMGFPCRLVINLTPISLRPPQSELHSLSTKPKKEKDSSQKSKEAPIKESKTDKIKKVKQIKKEHDYIENKKEKVKSKGKEPKKESLKPDLSRLKSEQSSPKCETSEKSNRPNSRSKVKNETTNQSLKTASTASPDRDSNVNKKREKKKTSKNIECENIKIAENKTVKTESTEVDKCVASEPLQGGLIVETVRQKRTRQTSASKQKLKLASETPPASNDRNDECKAPSLAEKLKTKTRKSPLPAKQLKVNSPPVLEKPDQLNENADENEEAPLLVSNAVREEINKNNSNEIVESGPGDKGNNQPTQVPKVKPVRKARSTQINKKACKQVPVEHLDSENQPAVSEHFKEIKKNVASKRTRSSPKPIDEPAASTSATTDNVKSIYFRAPSVRTTRSHAKQQKEDKLGIPQLDGADDIDFSMKKRQKGRKLLDSDDDFVPSPAKKPRPSNTKPPKKKSDKNRKVLSSSSEEDDVGNNKKMDIWVEVYAEKEDKWVPLNLFKTQVNNWEELRKSATNPVAYVFAWNNDNTIKDVSPRYCPLWNTATRKQRVDKEWLLEAIEEFLEKRTRRSKAEDVEFHRMHLEKPLPTSIAEYKNHPLYALQRHLLKFEAIYPPDALTLGFVRGEPIYARDCVHNLHSRETWYRSALVVKPGEKPYKIVKARPKWDRATNSVITDLPLEIFGKWQTMEYEPPIAANGIVPRSAYGNVDLFKPSMLPKKTVHIDLPGLNKVCKKLKIDCAPAVVGFDFHQGACHPITQGFVVCEEFYEKVVDEWNRQQEEAERKEDEKYCARVYGNWKKLYRGLLIRERLKRKYNFKTLQIDEGKSKKKKKS